MCKYTGIHSGMHSSGHISLHKKRRFPLKNSPVNATKSAGDSYLRGNDLKSTNYL